MPHGVCYLWNPWLVWLHVISDALITFSYYCIPFVLVYFIRKNRDLPFNRIFWMFGTFILACGTTHLMEIWNVWHGSYLVAGVLKAITAAVSVLTAAMLIPLVPKVISLPGMIHLQETNRKLEQKIAAHTLLNTPNETPLRRRITGSYIVAVLLITFIGLSSWRGSRLAADDSDSVAHTYAVMDALELTSKHVIEAATSARAFALTGQVPLLAHYQTARDTVAQDEHALRELTIDNLTQQHRLDVLDPQLSATLEFSERIVSKRQQMRTLPIPAEILESEQLMNAVRTTGQAIQKEEMQLLSQRTQKTRTGRRLTSFIIVVGIFVGAGLLTLARTAINREIAMTAGARSQIITLNGELEQRVEQRTAALQSEIVERKQAEEALKKSRATIEQAIKELADQKFALDQHAIVAVTDVQGTITYVNDKFCSISQYTKDELIGKNHRILNSAYHSKQFFQQMYHTIANGNVWHGEIKNRAKDGSTYWVDTTIAPFVSSEGKPLQYIAIRADITERKQVEEALAIQAEQLSQQAVELLQSEADIRKLNEDLEHRVILRTAQLESANRELEAFTYSVSHDLRAPLRHISGFSRVLSDEVGSSLSPEAQHCLERIQEGTRRMGELVDELLNLARIGRHAIECRTTDLKEIANEVIAMLKPETEGRTVEWHVGDMASVQCDPVLIRQVFQNLLTNALKFTRPRACATIEIGYMNEKDQPTIFIRDNGVGFNMKYSDKLFGVFQRLHRADEFEGTGIGLATVYRIIEKHGGRVWAEAELEKGATFFFNLRTQQHLEVSGKVNDKETRIGAHV